MPRRPKPSRLREISGNPGHRPINRNEPRPESVAICPEWLQGEARAEWERIAPELEDLKLLTGVDLAALGLYCESFATWRQATGHLRKHGLVDTTRNGFNVPSPYVSIANVAGENMRKAMIEFGATPASRSKVSATSEKGSNGWSKFAADTDPLDRILADLEKHQPVARHKN